MLSVPQALSAWVVLSGAGLAVAGPALPAETRADLTGPQPHYHSVLPPPQAELPPRPWAQANAWVARFSRGHADWLKATPENPAAAPRTPSVTAPTPAAPPHVH